MTDGKPGSDKEVAPTRKLPYVPPKLVELGTIRELTQAVGGKGSKDGGMGAGNDKTSL